MCVYAPLGKGLPCSALKKSGKSKVDFNPLKFRTALTRKETKLGVNDTQIDSIQYLNFAKKWFNSIFNSILFHKNSIQKII